MRLPWLVLVLGVALGCRRPRAPADAVAVAEDARSLAVAVPGDDAGTPPGVAVRDAAVAAVDVPEAPLRRDGPWRRMAVVSVPVRDVLERWADGPDLDGDTFPDELVAARWSVDAQCASDDRACPVLQEEDLAARATDGPMLTVYLARFSGDAAARLEADAGARVAGRLVSLRRLPLRSGGAPTSRLVGVHFAEFGPAVLARATLGLGDVAGGEATLDVVDVFVGAALDRRAGALVHHCVRVGARATRVGSLAVQLPGMAPLVWRAATGRPFTGCPAPADALETAMAEALAGDATLEVLEDRDVGAQGRVALVPRADGAGLDVAVTLPPSHRGRPGRDDASVRAHLDAGAPSDPLTAGPVQVLEATRNCAEDRVRYTFAGRRCEVRVPRDDGAFGGCAAGPSPLDPSPPRALAVLPGEADVPGETPDAGVPFRLLLGRGTRVFDVPLHDCATGRRRVSARPWEGRLPTGLAAAPGGRRVLAGIGFDLWLGDPGRPVAVLLNPPGGALPRGTVRALGFERDDTFAAVISTRFVRVRVSLPAVPRSVPDGLVVDAAELRRGEHAQP